MVKSYRELSDSEIGITVHHISKSATNNLCSRNTEF